MEHNMNCCRICLDMESPHVSILEDPTIHLHVKSCLPITINAADHLPKSICKSCTSQLNDFYNFQLNARCSQDWLETSLQEKTRKTNEIKTYVQPLPDSEYNSDSLLEFLNNTVNIDEYLNNLGKEDIPGIVNMLDRTVGPDYKMNNKLNKAPSPKKKESPSKTKKPIKMDIDILDSDIEVVEELLKKEIEPKRRNTDKQYSCFACNTKEDNIKKLSHHLSICDNALRTCVHCGVLFDSKQKMRQHLLTHSVLTPSTCNCGQQFDTKERLLAHCRKCEIDHISSMGFLYSCKQCGETFSERFRLYKHAKDHIQKSQERVCDVCGHTFIGNEALLKHRKEEHEKAEKVSYRCKVCSFSTADRKLIYSHVQKHTEIKEPNHHLCELCGRRFATHATLQRHSSKHASNISKCHICHKQFADLKSKEEHLLEHVKIVMCEKCGDTVNNLDKHQCT